MKNFVKHFFAIILCVCILTVMSVSVYAEGVSLQSLRNPLVCQKVRIVQNSNQQQKLNMYVRSVNNITNGTNVTTWTDEVNDGTQYWFIESANTNEQTYIVRPYNNRNYVLNYYTDGSQNCTLYQEIGNNTADYMIKIVDESRGSMDEKYGFVLPEHMVCMTITNDTVKENGVAKGFNVKWKTPIAQSGIDNTQAWDVNKWFI